jgi:5-methylcytosine-specific restriction endonuclease McrA
VIALTDMIRDHIVSLKEGGQDIEENTQALCFRCNKAKTEEESTRGIRRAHDLTI